MMPTTCPRGQPSTSKCSGGCGRGCFRGALHESAGSCCAHTRGAHAQPTAMILDSRTLQSTPESGRGPVMTAPSDARARRSMPPSTRWGHLLALHVTRPTRRTARKSGSWPMPCSRSPATTCSSAMSTRLHRRQPPRPPRAAAIPLGSRSNIPRPKRGFVLLPRRWVVERSFAWAARFRRLAGITNASRRRWPRYHYLASPV